MLEARLENQGIPFSLIALFSAVHSLGMMGEYETDEVYHEADAREVYIQDHSHNQSGTYLCTRVWDASVHLNSSSHLPDSELQFFTP